MRAREVRPVAQHVGLLLSCRAPAATTAALPCPYERRRMRPFTREVSVRRCTLPVISGSLDPVTGRRTGRELVTRGKEPNVATTRTGRQDRSQHPHEPWRLDQDADCGRGRDSGTGLGAAEISRRGKWTATGAARSAREARIATAAYKRIAPVAVQWETGHLLSSYEVWRQHLPPRPPLKLPASTKT